MIQKLPTADCRLPIDFGGVALRPSIANRQSSPVTSQAFSMVELLVAMTLLSLIVLVLMTVFNSTQRAFRASVTQTDILEGGRAAMDLITTDLRNATPSYGVSNYYNIPPRTVNFGIMNNAYGYAPLVQPLAGGSAPRTNLLEYFFVLGRRNTTWTGAGYIVDTTSANPLYPLYRFYQEADISANPYVLYANFTSAVAGAQWTNMSHVMDGVVHLVVRAYDPGGYWLTNGYGPQQTQLPQNVAFSAPVWGEVNCVFYSNAVPAAVEVQLGVLEDRTLQRALSLPNFAPAYAQLNYLAAQSGHVQLFRQRVTIPNVDPSPYQ